MGYKQRILMYTKNESILPKGYTQLEYIESSGTQYIATGVSTTNQQISVSTEMASNYISNYTKALGYSASTSGPPFSLWTINNNYAGYGTETIPTGTTISQFHTIIMNNNSVTISEFYIFDVNPNVGNYARTTGKIKIVTISVDGVEVRKLYPAKDSNDVVGMYDTINDVFYTNQGTGDFIAGPEGGSEKIKYGVVGRTTARIPAAYTELSNISLGGGTQYIDTGVTPNKDYSAELTGSCQSFGKFIFGTIDSPSYSGSHGYTLFVAGSGGNSCWGDTHTNTNIAGLGVSLNVKFQIEINKTGIYNKLGTAVPFTSEAQAYTATSPIYLFRTPFSSSYDYQGMFYEFKCWDDSGTLIRHMVPAKRGSDDVVGLYDLCGSICSATNSPFYTNAGAGVLIPGSEMTGTPYRLVQTYSED